MQFAVIGAGNMGVFMVPNLARAGERVALIDVWEEHIRRIRINRLPNGRCAWDVHRSGRGDDGSGCRPEGRRGSDLRERLFDSLRQPTPPA